VHNRAFFKVSQPEFLLQFLIIAFNNISVNGYTAAAALVFLPGTTRTRFVPSGFSPTVSLCASEWGCRAALKVSVSPHDAGGHLHDNLLALLRPDGRRP
jgi:hypothetical protein